MYYLNIQRELSDKTRNANNNITNNEKLQHAKDVRKTVFYERVWSLPLHHMRFIGMFGKEVEMETVSENRNGRNHVDFLFTSHRTWAHEVATDGNVTLNVDTLKSISVYLHLGRNIIRKKTHTGHNFLPSQRIKRRRMNSRWTIHWRAWHTIRILFELFARITLIKKLLFVPHTALRYLNWRLDGHSLKYCPQLYSYCFLPLCYGQLILWFKSNLRERKRQKN